MFLGDNKICRKKILFICSFLVFFLSCLFVVASPSPTNAVRVNNLISISNYWQSNSPNNPYVNILLSNQNLPAQILNTSADMTSNKMLQFSASTGQSLTGKYFYGKVKFGLSVSTTAIPGSSLMGGFYCERITNDNTYIKPEQGTVSSLNSHVDSCTVSDTVAGNQTSGYHMSITISTSGVLLSSSTVTSYVVSLSSDESNPFMRVFNSNDTVAYILNTMEVDFQLSADETVASMGEINQNLSSIDNSINSSASSEQERWEIERQEQAEKEAELEEQSSGLSLSASITANPFTQFFLTDPFGSPAPCYTTVRIHELFNASPWTVCSPYGSKRYIFTGVTTFVMLALLIRLYYKKLKGGVDG